MRRVGLGGARSEVRVGLLGAPTLLLVLAWAGCRLHGPGAADRLGTSLAALLCMAGAARVLPVLITTASGPETQAFAVVYLLGFGFAVDELTGLGFDQQGAQRRTERATC